MKNRRNTRRGRVKRWRLLVSVSGQFSDYESRETEWPGVSFHKSIAYPGKWLVVWYAPTVELRLVSHRREAFQVAEAIVRGRR